MSQRTIVAETAPRGAVTSHAVIWVSDKERLAAAREALRSLRATFPDLEELSFKEGDGIGVRASFGDVDMESLVDAEEGDARDVWEDNHWLELGDPEAGVASLQETLEENFGSVRVHVTEDCFYVTAMMEDDPIESLQVPY